jgi:hypothetical protein
MSLTVPFVSAVVVPFALVAGVIVVLVKRLTLRRSRVRLVLQ